MKPNQDKFKKKAGRPKLDESIKRVNLNTTVSIQSRDYLMSKLESSGLTIDNLIKKELSK